MNDVFFRTRWIGVWLALSIHSYLCLVLTHSARSIKTGYTYVIRLRKIIARHTKYRHTYVSITDITYRHSSRTSTGRRLSLWVWYAKFDPSAVCGAPITPRY